MEELFQSIGTLVLFIQARNGNQGRITRGVSTRPLRVGDNFYTNR